MSYKLDRTAFSMSSHAVHEPAITYWKTKTASERVRVAFYLNSVAYNFDISNPPKLDKTIFSMRSGKL